MKSFKIYIVLFALLSPLLSHSATERSLWMAPESRLNSVAHTLKSGKIVRINTYEQSTYSFHKIMPSINHQKHIRYYQTYKGIPIWGRQIIVHTTRRIPKISGVLVSDIEKDLAENQILLSPAEVTSSYLSHVHTPIKAQKIEKIIYLDKKHIAHIAYLLSFYTDVPNTGMKNPQVIFDAVDGHIFKQWDEMKTSVSGRGPGGSALSLPYRSGAFQYGNSLPDLPSLGTFPMENWLFWCYMETPNHRLINLENIWVSQSRINYIFPILDEEESEFHLSSSYGFCWPWSKEYSNDTDDGYAPVNEAFSPNNDAMYFIHETLELYHDHGIDFPLGQKDLPIRVFTHVSGLDNAFSIPTLYTKDGKILSHQQIVIGNGDRYFTALSQTVIAHELSHNFTALNSSLIYKNQSGAINEAFSDMAAVAIMDKIRSKYSFYWDGEDWSLGRESTKDGKPLRYIDHPAEDGLSIEHTKQYNDKLDVHYGSGVFNRAFYLLSNKPNWSIAQAFQVMVDANQNYWEPQTTFNKASCGVIQAAKDHHLDAASVIESFNEVGVYCEQ